MNERVFFNDENHVQHYEGEIVCEFQELRDPGGYETCYEPLLSNLNDVLALMQLAKDTFGTWKIEDGRVVKA